MTEMHADPEVARLAHAVLLPGFSGTSVPSWLARAVEDGLGGVIYFAHNLTADPAGLSAQLHGLRPGLLLASDEEGGTVTRLHAASGSPYPGHAALGAATATTRTYEVAAAMGGDLSRAGIDIAFAPVVDVHVDPDNPVIGVRSFGADPGRVASHGAAFVDGLHAAGVAATAKHFPGHGDTKTDSHTALPVIDIDPATLYERDLVPFSAAVEAGAELVMPGHIRIPALDEAPASLSARCYQLLRTELGFTGIAVTDALDMRAVAHHTGARDAVDGIARGAVAALSAGADLLCLGNPRTAGHPDQAMFSAARDAVLDAVRSGALPRSRLAEAAERVTALGSARAAA
ncbi:beta-N-acetylhexosaminidase [Lipingzhangella halophila]|uniref:Beta-N-acetylhexosaminidase n=1 Tax=Lipingzhangella halophila TaxID=1783352 RepID=A0A7W7RJH8_9ACTN|nr:glycoside hydrolase family 3 N-terminal domain-containing protein [Lipingzhangella halophila]MBB4933129.1 beta-N-acetylhexosaminidase [Lipingzhangella halophila]